MAKPYHGYLHTHTGYVPGAASRGTIIRIFKHHQLQQSREAKVHQCLKKSIWRFLLFSKRLLKLLTVAASISSWDKLLQRLITHWEKKWRRQSQRQLSFTNFYECPRVTESSSLLKNRFHGTDDSCFTILNTSIISARFLLSSSDHNPSSSSLSS